MKKLRKIPIEAAKKIAVEYGYHQVVIIGRRVGPDGIEHVTTYGVNRMNCSVAARIGTLIKYRIMGWKNESTTK